MKRRTNVKNERIRFIQKHKINDKVDSELMNMNLSDSDSEVKKIENKYNFVKYLDFEDELNQVVESFNVRKQIILQHLILSKFNKFQFAK